VRLSNFAPTQARSVRDTPYIVSTALQSGAAALPRLARMRYPETAEITQQLRVSKDNRDHCASGTDVEDQGEYPRPQVTANSTPTAIATNMALQLHLTPAVRMTSSIRK